MIFHTQLLTAQEKNFQHFISLENCKIIERVWLVYSISCDRMFSFCCNFFTSSGTQECILSTLDKAHQSAIKKEKQHWKDVIIRIITAIHYLVKHHDALKGSSDVINTEHRGKFIGLIERMGKFDATIIEHLRTIKNKVTRIHYLGHDIQNELIQLMALEVKKTILRKIKSAKYTTGLYTRYQ